MTTYIIRRLLMAIVTLWIVTMVIFLVIRLLPGDPLIIYLGQSVQSGNMSVQELEHLRIEYGLDKPIPIQYINWISGIFHGDLGTSINYREHVGRLLLERFPITLHLAILALGIGVSLGILLGIASAIRRGTWIDLLATSIANIGITIPVFWLGLLLMYAFGLKLGWLPIAGYTSPLDNFWLSTRQVIMPVICLSITSLAIITRQMRSSMLEVITRDYVRTAWAKGLQERTIIIRHVLKNSLIPIITLVGISIGLIISGSFVVETVFAIPGVGRLMVGSIFAQDYVVIQSGTLVIASIILIVNLLVDISYGWLDPRIRYN
jgi:peptide/nickel transport system permease protein